MIRAQIPLPPRYLNTVLSELIAPLRPVWNFEKLSKTKNSHIATKTNLFSTEQTKINEFRKKLTKNDVLKKMSVCC